MEPKNSGTEKKMQRQKLEVIQKEMQTKICVNDSYTFYIHSIIYSKT